MRYKKFILIVTCPSEYTGRGGRDDDRRWINVCQGQFRLLINDTESRLEQCKLRFLCSKLLFFGMKCLGMNQPCLLVSTLIMIHAVLDER